MPYSLINVETYFIICKLHIISTLILHRKIKSCTYNVYIIMETQC